MLKALIKKQLAELASVYSFNKKKGQQRSKGGAVGIIILLAFCALSCGFAFFGMGMLFSSSFIPQGLGWLHFALMGAIAVCVSLIGEVFATYSMLYNAKDNELLLSMPIPGRTILLARMSTLYIMSVIFAAIVFIPAMIAYWINGGAFTALGFVFCIILLFVIALAALALACLLGWVVALVGSKIKGNKAVISVLVSVLLLGVYYVVYFRMNKILNSAVENADKIAAVMRGKLFPLYHMGMAATGKPLYMLVFTAGVCALFALICLLLAKNFTKLALADRTAKKASFRGDDIKSASFGRALLGREFMHFTSSAAYMLNCGLGIIMSIGISVFALIKADTLQSGLAGIASSSPLVGGVIPVLLAAAVMFLLSLNCFTAPSVSLEGNNIWIVQTMPADPKHALRAKLYMHLILNGVTAAVCCTLICLAFGVSLINALLVLACVLAFVWLTAALGLAVNIKKPSLDWTNETVPIKQGASVVITMFSGWAIAIVFGAVGLFAGALIGAYAYLAVMIIAFLVTAYLITRWIDTKGAKIFSQL